MPSTLVKSEGKVSEERSLFPRQMHNLNSVSTCTGVVCTNYLPRLAQGFATVNHSMATAGRGMYPCPVDLYITAGAKAAASSAQMHARERRVAWLQRATGLLLYPSLLCLARSCRAALEDNSFSCQQALLELLL